MGASPAMPSPGQLLSHYRIVRKIGEGGMGVVFLARDEHLERDVALKVLPAGTLADDEARRRFRQEALALSRLNHPNIAVIHDFDTQSGRDFLVMEFVPGATLDERLADGPLAEGAAVALGLQLADALAAAHGAGILHRDLKPGNLRLTPEGRLKVLDFGLAKLLRRDPDPNLASGEVSPETMTGTGVRIGTPAYMAPEQWSGGAVDERSDVYAAGAVLFETATGSRPHPEREPTALAAAVLSRPPTPPRSLRPGLSTQLERVLLKALERDPAARYPSARALHDDLARLAVGTAPVAPAWPSARRARWALVAGGVALATVLGVALWSSGALRRGLFPSPASAGPPRIAVLPFANLGRSDDAFFTAGMTDEITGRLAAVGGLSVISRTSSAHYAGTDKTVRRIGKELGVAYVLEGSVRWAPGGGARDRVRISSELIRVRDDLQLWTESYDRVIDDVFAIQSEIAREVVRELGVTLREVERRRIDQRPTASPEAYQAYLRARYLAAQPHFSIAAWRDVIHSYEEAVRLDPDFALAWAELASAHGRFYYLKADLSQARRDLSRQALERATALAPEAPEAHLAAARYHMWIDGDTDRARAELAAAERGLPNDVDVLSARSTYLQELGRWDEARALSARAFALSPRDPELAGELILIDWVTRRYARAESWCDSALALATSADQRIWPNLFTAFVEWSRSGATPRARAAVERVPLEHEFATWARFWQEMGEGRYREAADLAASAPGGWFRHKVWAGPTSLFVGFAQMAAGDSAQARRNFATAREELTRAVAAAPDDPRLHSSLGLAWAGLGRKGEAIREARRAVELLPLSRDAFYGVAPLADLSIVYTMTGEPDAAIAILRQLLAVPSWFSPAWLRFDPRYRPLAGDPRFERLRTTEPTAAIPAR
jgi:TolB-like protein/Flp pilus assembly protein TadD